MRLHPRRQQLSWVDEALAAVGRTWTAHRVCVNERFTMTCYNIAFVIIKDI